jgi:hypothetical protein
MSKEFSLEIFSPELDHPLLAEHHLILQWIQETKPPASYFDKWEASDLKLSKLGLTLDSSAEGGRIQMLRACIEQLEFWQGQVVRLEDSTESDIDRVNLHFHPLWLPVSAHLQHLQLLLVALIRRPIELDVEIVRGLVRWLCRLSGLTSLNAPIGPLFHLLGKYAKETPIDDELRSSMRNLGISWIKDRNKSISKHALELAQCCAVSDAVDLFVAESGAIRPSPVPSPVGNPFILQMLKKAYGLGSDSATNLTIETGPDRFVMVEQSPLAEAHEVVTKLLLEHVALRRMGDLRLEALPTGKLILEMGPRNRGRVLIAAMERASAAILSGAGDLEHETYWRAQYAVVSHAGEIQQLPALIEADEVFDVLLYLATRNQAADEDGSIQKLLDIIKANFGDGSLLTEGQRYVLHLWRCARILIPPFGAPPDEVACATRWIGDRMQFFLIPGEHWTEGVNASLAGLPVEERDRWIALLRHMLTATSARPTAKWQKTSQNLSAAVGHDAIVQMLSLWLPLVLRGRSIPMGPSYISDTRSGGDLMNPENATILRGLLWLIPQLKGRDELVRLIGSVALSAYKKVPGVGPRAVKVGNAAVYALSEIVSSTAIGQLAMLRVRVRFGTAQKEIEKAYDAAAAVLELPRDQVEEMSVPACGLDGVGKRVEMIAGYRAEINVTGSEANLLWFDAHGKHLKSAPAAAKKQDPELFKELQQDLKDVNAMLSAQRLRIDSLFLEQKSWPAKFWREFYVDHPLVGTIARRLIWCVDETPLTVVDGQPMDCDANAVEVKDDAVVTLWHPAGRSVAEVLAWRSRIEELRVVQPFKQAHREVYPITDAERLTATYSNRFAGHVLRQHQFNALCGARRWKNRLRLMVDDFYAPATRELPACGLRAEFWIEGIGQDFGVDSNDSGVYLRLASDQVRFYRTEAAENYAHAGGGGYNSRAAGPGDADVNEPISLDQVPALVLSEVFRDIDLFVGVASVGNDAGWIDGGPGGRYQGYCRSWSFGELENMGQNRKQVLERLVPRLKIASRCQFEDRFLVVRGEYRTYKIHLGSGNIMMSPNDQYLCIVPDSSWRTESSQVYLPFEGDTTLSIILSKAFLLAEDSKIKDPTILHQIR